MRRVGFIGVLGLVLVALAAPGVSAHHSGASFGARANTATQGGKLHITAKVKHAQRGSTFSAQAVVHFASGDVTVALQRRGKAFVAAGNVSVDSSETPGTVPVDVTITYNGDETEVETDADVEDDPTTDNGDDTCDPPTTTCDDQGGDDGGDGGDGGTSAAFAFSR